MRRNGIAPYVPGHSVGRNRVTKRMRILSIRLRVARNYKATTNSNHRLPLAPNVLQQDFAAAAANQMWVSGIIYIATDEGWLYIAAVMDVYARKVVGYALSDRINTPLVVDALTMALFRRRRPRGVIVHSDRGSQYCAAGYQRLLNAYGLKPSMTSAAIATTTRRWKAGTGISRRKRSMTNALPRVNKHVQRCSNTWRFTTISAACTNRSAIDRRTGLKRQNSLSRKSVLLGQHLQQHARKYGWIHHGRPQGCCSKAPASQAPSLRGKPRMSVVLQ
jgi:transposase InsO family protein